MCVLTQTICYVCSWFHREKINLGLSMASKWTDPAMLLIYVGVIMGWTVVTVSLCAYEMITHKQSKGEVWHGADGFVSFLVAIYILRLLYNSVYLNTGPAETTKYIDFADTANGRALKAKFSKSRIPIVTLYDSYFNLDLDFKGGVYEVLKDNRYDFIAWRPTMNLIKFLLLQFVPGISSSFKDKLSTKKEIADHYDRGNDFFACFLGESMVYTSGVFHGTHQTLEQAQFNKMSMICNKLQIKKGHRTLDIGCGWGSLVRHMSREFGAKATGVTLSKEGAKWCREYNEREFGNPDATEILIMDYRDIPKNRKFNAISSVEMAEHVGLANFQLYLSQVKRLLTDDGMFVCQVSGIRQNPNWEDTMWGLFMSRYIFPGADASTPAWWYTKEFEKAGFNVHSLENVGVHYAHTIHRWYQNWNKEDHRKHILEKYDERLFRLWNIFLAWSALAPVVSYGSCLQFLVHPSTRVFPQDIFCNPGPDNVSGKNVIGVGLRNDNM